MLVGIETARKLHAMYVGGVKLDELALIAKCSKVSVKRSFSRHGFPLKKSGQPSKIPLDKILELHDDYKKGASFAVLSEQYKMSPTAIFNAFKRNNLETRPSDNATRTVDERCFDTLTPESLYWIGFLMADGWVNCRNVIGVGAKSADHPQIVNFKNFVKGNQNVISHSTRNFCYFQFKSVYAANKLNEYGVAKNKSLTATPSVDVINSRDFWRGMIDGDGCIYTIKARKDRHGINLAGSFNCVKAFKEFCIQNVGWNVAKIKPQKNIFVVTFTGSYATRVIDLLYTNCSHGQRLERKYELYLKSKLLLNIVPQPVADPRFGTVGSYPDLILEELNWG